MSELARLVGVSPSLISQIERGQSRPSVSTLFELAEALKVPVDAFFSRETAEPPVDDASGVAGEAAASEHRTRREMAPSRLPESDAIWCDVTPGPRSTSKAAFAGSG